MHKSGDSLVAVISDILDFSKIEDNKLILNPEVENLEDVLGSVTNLFYAKAQEKHLDLKFKYDPNLPKYFEFDVTRTRQIVSNLIGNAVKFTENGHVSVSITGRLSQAGADMQIDIQDTGMGIAEDKLALVFEKFTQADGAITNQFGGTGLGLAISRKLARAMGGDLNLTSELGRGSKFSLRLPMKLATGSTLQAVTPNSLRLAG